VADDSDDTSSVARFGPLTVLPLPRPFRSATLRLPLPGTGATERSLSRPRGVPDRLVGALLAMAIDPFLVPETIGFGTLRSLYDPDGLVGRPGLTGRVDRTCEPVAVFDRCSEGGCTDIEGVNTAALGSSFFSMLLSPSIEPVGVFFAFVDAPGMSPSCGLFALLTPATLATISFSLLGNSEMINSWILRD
jgi:hypothetical protein